MALITLCRTDAELPTGGDLHGVRELLFRSFDGARRDDKRAWRMFWKKLLRLSCGEMAEIETRFPRSGPFHRRHMAMENAVFDAQEKFSDFEQFRYWLKVGSAWVTWAAGPKGGVVPIPKSISYAKADEAEFRAFHDQMVDFLRGEHAAHYLWPHLGVEQAHGMMDAILAGFGE